jgi:hypothetical protein
VGLVRYGAQQISELSSRNEFGSPSRMPEESPVQAAQKSGFWSWLRAAF